MFKTNLSGSDDLPLEIDYTKLFDTKKVTNNNKIIIPTEKEEIKIVRNEPEIEKLSECNSGKWQFGLLATCAAIYFGLPLLFGNK